MPQHLFTYGTLRPGQAPPEIARVVDALIPIGQGTIRARLYDLGAYPGVVLEEAQADGTPSGLVEGFVYQLPANSEVLAQLDAYEDFRPADAANSLFLRQATLATLTGGEVLSCWVYTWNRTLPDAAQDLPYPQW